MKWRQKRGPVVAPWRPRLLLHKTLLMRASITAHLLGGAGSAPSHSLPAWIIDGDLFLEGSGLRADGRTCRRRQMDTWRQLHSSPLLSKATWSQSGPGTGGNPSAGDVLGMEADQNGLGHGPAWGPRAALCLHLNGLRAEQEVCRIFPSFNAYRCWLKPCDSSKMTKNDWWVS